MFCTLREQFENMKKKKLLFSGAVRKVYKKDVCTWGCRYHRNRYHQRNHPLCLNLDNPFRKSSQDLSPVVRMRSNVYCVLVLHTSVCWITARNVLCLLYFFNVIYTRLYKVYFIPQNKFSSIPKMFFILVHVRNEHSAKSPLYHIIMTVRRA